jgi:hypothetical protein
VITGEGAAPADPLAATFATPAEAVAAPALTPTVGDATPLPEPAPGVSTGAGMPAAPPAAGTTGQTAAPGRGRTLLFVGALAVLVVVGGVVAALVLSKKEPAPPAAQPAPTATTATPDARVAAATPPDSGVAGHDAATVAAAAPPPQEHAGVRPAGQHRPERRHGSRHTTAGRHADDHGHSHTAAASEPPEQTEPAPKKQGRQNVVLRTVPYGATVVREGKNIGKTPLKIPVPRKQRLVISLSGYRSRTIEIGPTSPAEIKLPLAAAPPSHKSISQLERNCRSGRVGLLDCARLRLKLRRERDDELEEAKQRWERRQITWDQYKALVDRIHATYR